MNNPEINNAKTAEEAIENAVSAIGALATFGALQAIDSIVQLDPTVRGAITTTISVGIMGLLKTIIRRIRNRRKHRG
jgi:hypothetical protein